MKYDNSCFRNIINPRPLKKPLFPASTFLSPFLCSLHCNITRRRRIKPEERICSTRTKVQPKLSRQKAAPFGTTYRALFHRRCMFFRLLFRKKHPNRYHFRQIKGRYGNPLPSIDGLLFRLHRLKLKLADRTQTLFPEGFSLLVFRDSQILH